MRIFARIDRIGVALAAFCIAASGAHASSNLPDIKIIDLTKNNKSGGGVYTVPLDQGIPDDVADQIKKTGAITIIPIVREEKFSQQVIKADEIVFSPGARLTLTGLNYPWVAIVAKKMKFNDPRIWSTIQRDPAVDAAADGAAGQPGAAGANGSGEVNRQGNPGQPGQPGGPALTGATSKLPKIYLIVGEFTDPAGSIPPGFLNIGLFLAGINGGDGGIGGRGGNGGNGAPGKEGATSLVDCMEGPGRGGRGGNSGQGGRGGDAGAGGDGAELIYVSLATGIEVLSYARVNNVGGQSGRPGRANSPGNPGLGARGGRSNGWCGAGPRGDNGDHPSPATQGPGSEAREGSKGTVTGVVVPSIDVFF